MKQIHKNIILSAGLLFASAGLMAQTDVEKTDTLAQKVNVAFRTVDRADLMGGVSSVNVEELTNKSYSLYSLDNMQSLVGGYNGQLWNMGEALVLVDGVPREANNIRPTEIAQITFLKAAQAVVLYGSRGAKGVILITTKRGCDKDLRVSARANAGINVPKSYPKYLASAEYMTLYNEALRNDGLDPAFSDEQIYNYASGSNPYRYPNINFFSDDYIRKTSQDYNGVAEFSGGGRYANFYTNIGYESSNDLLNFGESKNNRNSRLNIRGNVDLRMNDWISGWVNANAIFYDSRHDKADYWANSATLRPTAPGSRSAENRIKFRDQTGCRLQSFFADTTYEVIREQELHYENVLFIVFKLVGFYTKVEYHTNNGRVDLILQTDKFIYIMEFKLNGTAEEALQQINNKRYALPFEADGRKLFKIGINFSEKTRNIEKWVVAS